MEVNSGTTDKKAYARRHADGTVSGGVRNLDWSTQATDLQLLPQSPLSIQNALQSIGSRLWLVALDSTPHADKQSAAPLAAQSATEQSQDSATSDSNCAQLRTKYNAKTLREKCRQLVIESALVKSRNEKRLFIVAGFLNWKLGPNDPVCQSPLLFYPVRLITQDRSSGEGVDHLLLNEDAIPDYNQHLRQEFQRITNIELPLFNPRQSISYFLQQVVGAVSELPETSVDYRIRMGIASAPAGIDPEHTSSTPKLDKIPAQFRFSLAKRLIEDQELSDLQTTLQLLGASNDFRFNEQGSSTDVPIPDIARVREFSMLLAQYGLGHIEFHQLPELPDRIDNWIEDIEPALASELIQETLAEHKINAIQLVKLSGIMELLDKAPLDMEVLLHRDLAYRGTHILFKRAKHQAQLIYEELGQLQRHFHLDRVPAKGQLLQLIDELGGPHEQEIDVVDSDYFHARRQFMNFSADKPSTLSHAHKQLLGKLVKVLRFRELFVNNTEYRLALGPAYRGLKTDWDKLEQVLEYTQELRQVLGSAAIAATALEHWSSFRSSYNRGFSKLITASTAIAGLRKIIKSADQTTCVSELLIKARLLSDQLRDWNLDYGLIHGYADKSADSLLHLFSGKAGIDARTEDLVRDANNRIHDFLLDNQEQIAFQQISETIAWLNNAVNTESISVTDILREMELAIKLAEES